MNFITNKKNKLREYMYAGYTYVRIHEKVKRNDSGFRYLDLLDSNCVQSSCT